MNQGGIVDGHESVYVEGNEAAARIAYALSQVIVICP